MPASTQAQSHREPTNLRIATQQSNLEQNYTATAYSVRNKHLFFLIELREYSEARRYTGIQVYSSW